MHSLGYLHDDATLSLAYNACDVFVTPSLAENLSNAIMESLSCGTPVVAFDIGGNADLITHKHNGYLAKENDTNDLKDGIEWVLNLDSQSYTTLSHNARTSVLQKYAQASVATKYIQMYNHLIGGGDREKVAIAYAYLSCYLDSALTESSHRPHTPTAARYAAGSSTALYLFAGACRCA